MRDEHPPQSPSADGLSAKQRNTDGQNESRSDDARSDAAGPNAERWVPLAYDLEQNGDSSPDRGEVF
jgi:hypothetical protein